MASDLDNHDDDSFIILGTSPGTSLDMKVNGITNGDVLEESHIEDIMKDLSIEANMAFKAHFKLGDCPSPASMMVASTIVSEDKSTEELQKRFGELLDENVLLKETLKQNNDSIKEQFLLIASCQEDMLKTHMIHKDKFDETRDLVERLRQENKKLKQDIVRLTEVVDPQVNSETGEQSKQDSSKAGDSVKAGDSGKSGPSSAVEFVSSPDDDTINKLTAQLELVEKQRRQVIVDNEKLTWQKESLEHIIDATSKERDELKEKLKNAELHLSIKDHEYASQIRELHLDIQDLQTHVLSSSNYTNLSTEEIKKRDAIIQQLEAKIITLQGDFRNSQLKILDLENVKMEFTRHKSGTVETIKLYKDQIQDLNNRLKEAQTTVFQPIRFSVSSEHESTSSEYASYLSNVKLYDRTLKHLSEYLNSLTHGTSDSLMQTLGLVASLQDFKLDKTTVDRFKAGLNEMKQLVEKQHSAVLANIGQVRATMSIFEGIFKDYNEVLKKGVTKEKTDKRDNPHSVGALTQALVARGQEIQTLEAELKAVKTQNETCEVLKAQLDLYKSDFEAEREARQKMASEKETILTDLRKAQRCTQELKQQLEGSLTHQQDSSAASNQRPSTGTPKNTATSASGTVRKKKKVSSKEEELTARESSPPPLRFDCPVCDKPFKTLLLLQQHVDSCLL